MTLSDASTIFGRDLVYEFVQLLEVQCTKKPPLPFEEEGVGGNGLTGDDHESRVEL